MKRFITSVALLVCTMLMTGSFVQLVAQTNVDPRWRQKVIPGVYQEIPESHQPANDFMPFKCYPPWDSWCATILWRPLDSDGKITAGQPGSTDRVAVWIPSKGIGYTDVRLNGITSDPATQSAVIGVTGTNATQLVNSMSALEEWIESTIKK